MKLPEDKKERVKVLILIAIGAVALVYGLWVGVVSPMTKGRKDGATRIGDLDAKIEKAMQYLNAIIDKLVNSRLAVYMNAEKDKIEAIIQLPKDPKNK